MLADDQGCGGPPKNTSSSLEALPCETNMSSKPSPLKPRTFEARVPHEQQLGFEAFVGIHT